MDNSFQTSFIPKKPSNSVESQVKQPRSFFYIISIILLVIVVLSSAGFFLYKNYLTKEKDTLSSSLLKSRNSFDQGTISELERFDNRASTAKTLLNDHVIFSSVFKLFNQLTVPTIQYTKFDLSLNNNNQFEVQLSGIARDYKSIALQSDALNSSNNPYFKNVVFSNLNKNKNNYVMFDLDFVLDSSLTSYEKNFSLEQALGSSSSVSTQGNNQLPGNLINN